MADERQWWTVEQAATFLSVNQETVRRWLRTGLLKGTLPFGNRGGYRVARADLDALVQLRSGKTLEEWGAAGQARSDASKRGHARAASLTPEQRSESARKAALARWGKA